MLREKSSILDGSHFDVYISCIEIKISLMKYVLGNKNTVKAKIFNKMRL